jgi:hypothetical protein
VVEVNFTAVAEEYQSQGIWSTMSHMAETEARILGAKKIKQQISNHSGFLASSLMKVGYLVEEAEGDEGPDSWSYHPLVKQL